MQILRRIGRKPVYYARDPRRLAHGWRTIWERSLSYTLNTINHRYYPAYDLSGQLIEQKRTSDTIFIFGSGMSLHDITPEEWAHVDKHNTLGWHLFSHQTFVHADFYIFREVHSTAYFKRLAEIKKHVDLIEQNPLFDDVVWVIQRGWMAISGNTLVGHRLLPKDTRIVRFHNSSRSNDVMPKESFSDGLVHGESTLTDAINTAYACGWKRIVLIGVDLYDTRYYVRAQWDDDEKWRAENPDYQKKVHPTAQRGIVNNMGRWREWLNEHHVEIYVYNPKSLLNEVMPIYDWRKFDE